MFNSLGKSAFMMGILAFVLALTAVATPMLTGKSSEQSQVISRMENFVGGIQSTDSPEKLMNKFSDLFSGKPQTTQEKIVHYSRIASMILAALSVLLGLVSWVVYREDKRNAIGSIVLSAIAVGINLWI